MKKIQFDLNQTHHQTKSRKKKKKRERKFSTKEEKEKEKWYNNENGHRWTYLAVTNINLSPFPIEWATRTNKATSTSWQTSKSHMKNANNFLVVYPLSTILVWIQRANSSPWSLIIQSSHESHRHRFRRVTSHEIGPHSFESLLSA